jgi:serine protein kinase
MLHGPNGSAKSSLIECLAQALEDYSSQDVGAVYRFNWVFPSNKVSKKRLGFGGPADRASLQSFAHLDDDDVDARLPADLRDHPLLLIAQPERKAILERLVAEGHIGRDEPLGDYLLDGDLAPRSRAIFDALLNAYHGDLQRVLQHVQVTRFTFSRRYRHGVVTIEPQLHVDAGIRQVTMDQAMASLPSALKNLSLFEPYGDLVDSNRGLINYNDLLKKPIDAFKYLLATCEKGTVALPNAILHLDTVFLASSNEAHLKAFKEYPDFASFKGRMDLVRMPYLRSYDTERRIYDEHLRAGGLADELVPHTTFVLALWAVLTRLKRPRAELYPARIRDVVARLSPMEKAELYAGEREPEGLTPELSRLLWSVLPELLAEGQEEMDYEGLLRRVAAGDEGDDAQRAPEPALPLGAVSPLGVHGGAARAGEAEHRLRVLAARARRRLPRPRGLHRSVVEERWLGRVDDEVRASMGLVSAEQYDELVARYIRHVSYSLKKEKVFDEAAGRMEEPDKRLMDQLEGVWKVGSDRDAFRQNLIGRIGAWRIDFPGQPIDYRRLFPKLFHALEQDYYEQQRGTIRRLSEHVLAVLSDNPAHGEALAEADRERAEVSIERLRTEFGYTRPAVREAIGALLSHRP